jgi:uncharacterized protein YajQ (UPF0234 family)
MEKKMPTFDIVSKVIMHEVNNAIDQANREVQTRFDFKGSGALYKLKDEGIELLAQNKFQLSQMLDILHGKLAKRGVDIQSLENKEPELNNNQAKQQVTIRQGIDAEVARTIVKLIKDKKLKVQAAIQGEQIRVTGKKRDDLQEVIAMLREEKVDLPLQFDNFRD